MYDGKLCYGKFLFVLHYLRLQTGFISNICKNLRWFFKMVVLLGN